MITHDNLNEVINQISIKNKNRLRNTMKEYCVIELHVFNTGSVTTIKLTDDYNRYKNVSYCGNCILETTEVLDILDQLTMNKGGKNE